MLLRLWDTSFTVDNEGVHAASYDPPVGRVLASYKVHSTLQL